MTNINPIEVNNKQLNKLVEINNKLFNGKKQHSIYWVELCLDICNELTKFKSDGFKLHFEFIEVLCKYKYSDKQQSLLIHPIDYLYNNFKKLNHIQP